VVVADVGGGAGDRVQGPLDGGADGVIGLAPMGPPRRWVRGAGEVEEVRALGVVEPERVGETSSTLSETPLMSPRSRRV
jgi:hypothetical protein